MADIESNLLIGFQALIEREVDRRVRPLEELLRTRTNSHAVPVEEYLDVESLARRIHSEPKTIRDWVHKKKIPFEKLPTGGIRFPWSKVEAWMKGEKS
jgi:excisionase family DNA binding protein